MKYQRFVDLPVWQLAADFAADMFSWASRPELRGLGDLANQLQRAVLSISNNIAEGFERGTINELLNFLYIARGSAGEVCSMLCVIERMAAKGKFTQTPKMSAEIGEFKAICESISRQLFGWANSLQNSTLQGQRHVTEQSLAADRQARRRKVFVDQIKESNERLMAQRLVEQRQQSPGTSRTDDGARPPVAEAKS